MVRTNDCMDDMMTNTTMPCMYINHDLENYYAQVELPGVKREDISLEVMENGLCLKGKKGESDIAGCWMLAHPISVDEVRAKYDSGLLDIVLPLKNKLTQGKKVSIE